MKLFLIVMIIAMATVIIMAVRPEEDIPLFQCPKCRRIADLDNWDVLGADDDKLFCNQCGAEVVPLDV